MSPPLPFSRSRWFIPATPRPDARWRMVCLGFAGGTAAYFKPWASVLTAAGELWPVELPGRGTRFGDPLIDDMDRLVSDLATAVIPLADRPLVLFGHSMGSAVGFALTRVLEARDILPALLICSGRDAPHRIQRRNIHRLPDDLIIAEMARLGGTPAEILDHKELMDLVLPIVRNDYRLIETYSPAATPKLVTPIHVLCGDEDADATDEGLRAWGDLTHGDYRLDLFPGGHFYLNDTLSAVLQTIAASVEAQVLRARKPAPRTCSPATGEPKTNDGAGLFSYATPYDEAR